MSIAISVQVCSPKPCVFRNYLALNQMSFEVNITGFGGRVESKRPWRFVLSIMITFCWWAISPGFEHSSRLVAQSFTLT